ncbi:MAG: TatD family nuclease-associated radical SAM protein [Clostridiales bacterium]|jgi:TatD family-associated radical SAM protein|nr:TatD family nuclease-associated radical SAM protein [Clostridiales bacterium]
MNNYLYEYGDKLYINLTNECSNNCDFCVRNAADGVGGYNLWLSKEPSAKEIIESLKKTDLDKYKEFVFCGFGEPLYALKGILEIGGYLKSLKKSVRLNTNGQADFICGAGTAEKLKNAVNTVSISLNASNAKKYNEVCKCAFGEKGFYAMLKFAEECVKNVDRVILSVVDTIGDDEIEKCRALTAHLGAEFRVRKYE